MNTKAMSEVYAIINIMDERIINRIPLKFINFIKLNRDVFYNPEFKELPENFDNLEHDTKVMFALIYKKYFKEDDTEYWKYHSEKKDSIPKVSMNIEENSLQNNNMIIYKKTFFENIKKLFFKIKSWILK